jgi:hypothetical protein
MIRRRTHTRVIPIRRGMINGSFRQTEDEMDAYDKAVGERAWSQRMWEFVPTILTLIVVLVATIVVRRALLRALDIWLLARGL